MFHQARPVTTSPEETNISPPLNNFTRRSNWVQCILGGIQDFLHVLSADGRNVYVSHSCKTVTGYEPNQLLGRLIEDLIHPDDSFVFAKEFQDAILHGNSFRIVYRFHKIDNDWIILESQCRPYIRDETCPQDPHGNVKYFEVAVMARPYLTQKNAISDSILDHFIERERLTRQIAELRREEVEFEMELNRHTRTDGTLSELDHGLGNILPQKQSLETQMTSTQQFLPKHPVTGALDSALLDTNEPRTEFPCRSVERCDIMGREGAGSAVVGDLGIPVSTNRTSKRASPRRAMKGGHDPRAIRMYVLRYS